MSTVNEIPRLLTPARPSVAVLGSGVSGLRAAYLLRRLLDPKFVRMLWQVKRLFRLMDHRGMLAVSRSPQWYAVVSVYVPERTA